MLPAIQIMLTSTVEETGLWCDTCLLPSVLRIHLWHAHFHLFARMLWCTEHGQVKP